MSDLPPFVDALMRSDAYPHPMGPIEFVQTHISYVFLGRDDVYKVKKAVDFGFLDFSTLGKRRHYCHAEVKLNSRLCADTYVGVVPIMERDGGYFVGGPGKVVEYAVHMKRLSADRMMDVMLARGQVTAKMVKALAGKMARFHETAETSPAIAKYGDWAIRYNQRENEGQWTPYVGRVISAKQDRILRAYAEAFYARRADVLRRRVERLRICRVHADLRSDAVNFTDGICVFDCVEFSRRINLLDVARDIGFLAMDLEYRGHPKLAKAFVDSYLVESRDEDLREVLDFYAMYSACVRGKVEAFLLDIPSVPEKDKRRATKAAQRYFDLACRYAEGLPPAMLVITCGLPASGKSTLARGLAESTGWELISSDVVRKEIADVPAEEHRYENYEAGIYAPDVKERTYEAMFAKAGVALAAGRSVVLDATFIRREHRRAAARLAKDTGAQFACAWVTASGAETKRRIERRIAEGTDLSDAGWAVYVAQKRRLQRPTEVPEERLIEVNSARASDAQVKVVAERLRALSPLSLSARGRA